MKQMKACLKAAVAALLVYVSGTAAWAANGVWNGTVDALWTNSANWSATPYPSVNDTASFTNNGNGQTTIDVAALSSIKTIIFDSPFVASYTIGTGAVNSQTLVMSDSGEFRLTDTAANSQLFNCGVQLGTTIAGGTYTLNNLNTNKTLTLNNVFGPAVGGTAGAKTLTINGAGNTAILGNIQKGGASNLTLTDNSSGTLTLSGSNTVLTLNMNGGTNSVVDIGNGFLALNNAGGTTLTSSQGGTINGTGFLWLSTSGSNYADNQVAAGKTLVINPSIISDGGFEVYGNTGTFVFNGTNTFAQDVIFNAAGAISVWKVGNRASLDSNLGKGTNINFNSSGAKLIYTGSGEESDRGLLLNNNATIDQSGTGNLKFTSPWTVNGTTKTLTLQGSTAGTGELAGAITNTVTSLSKNGTGTWILSGTNTYGGATTVSGGTLLVKSPGISSNSSVTVTSGAILGGNSTIYGNVVSANGMLAPADLGTVGTLSLGGTLTLTNSTLFFDISNVATDKISVVGALNVSGTNIVVLSFLDGTLPAGTNTLMTFSSRTGTGTFVLPQQYVNASLVTNATSLQLVVDNTATYNKIWKGTASGEWNTSELNWTNGIEAVAFATGDAVLFDDTAATFNITGVSPVLPGSVQFNNSKSNYVISASLDGDGMLFKLGSATVTLSGNNTYTGQTTIAAGTLTIGDTGVLGGGNYATNVINNGTLNYASSVAQTNSGVISGAGALLASGSGVLTLSGTNSYTGPTTVNAGSVLKLQNGAGLGTTAAGTTVNAGGTLELAGNIATLAEALSLAGTLSSQTGSNTYAGAITFQPGAVFNIGSGSTNIISAATVANGYGFTKMGTGKLSIITDPAQTGPFVVNEGTLELNHGGNTDAAFVIAPGALLRELQADKLGDNFNITNNGIWEMWGNDKVAGLSGNGLITRGNNTTATLTVGGNNASGAFSGVIENGLGTMNFAKDGTGIQTLSGTNTYTGTTAVNAGTLLVNAPGSLAAGSAVTAASAAILGGNGIVNGAVTLSAGANLAPGGVNTIGTLTLGSSLTLNGNSLFFDVSTAAQDRVNVATALTRSGVNAIVVNGALPVGDYILMTFASTTGAGTFSLTGVSNAWLEPTSTNLVLHVTSGSVGANLTWEGDKSLVWDSVTLNWLNGSTPSAFATGDAVLFDDTALNYTVSSGSTVSPSAVTFNNSLNTYNVSANIGGSGAVSKFGTGTLNLSGTNTYAGQTIVGQGTLAITSAGQLGGGIYAQDILLYNGTTFQHASSANQILSGVISGLGALTKSGSGTLILTNANPYTGATTLSSGTLIAKEFVTALGTGTLALSGGSTLELANNTGLAYGRNTTVSGAATVKSGRLTSGVGVTNTLGTLSINANTLTVSQGANIASGTAGLTFGATTMTGAPTFDVGAGTLLTLGALGGNFNFTKQGAGTLFFGSAGGRAGGNSTLTAGTLKVGNAAGLGTTGTTNVLNGGVLDLAIDTTVNAHITTVGGNTTIQSDKATVNSAGITHTLGALSIGAFTLNVTNGPNVKANSPYGLTFGTATMTGNATFNVENNGFGTGSLTLGAVGGAFTLTKNGAGTLILPGANTYNGVTTVNGGTLLVNGTLSTNVVTVGSGATLGGSGTITGAVNMVAGSILAPGGVNATNILTLANNSTNSLTLNGNTLLFDLPASGTVCDKINITGASGKLVLKNANKIALSFPYGSAQAGTYTLMTCTGGITTNSGATLTLLGTYPNATLSVVGNDVVLNVTSTFGLTWKGTLSDVWDNSILNWTNGSAAVSFASNDAVLFDDTTTNFTVSSVGLVSPSSVMFNNNASNYTISAIIGGTGPLVKSGVGTVTLSGTNTVSGGLTVNSGLLILTGTNTGGTAATTINGAGVLQIGNGGTSGTVLGSGTILSGNNGLQFNRTDPVSSPLVVNNKIDKNGSAAYNVVVNSGAVQLGGTTDNNSTAADVKNGATLILAKTSSGTVHVLGANSLVENGGKMVLGGTGGDQIYNSTSVNVLDGGVFDVNSLNETFATLTLAGTGIAGTGALINGTTTATPILTCAVALATNSAVGGPGNLTIAGVVSGASMAITKVGAGTVRLTGDPSLSGAFWVNEGILELQHTGSTDAPFIIAPGATLRDLSLNDIGDTFAFTNNGTFDMRVNDIISTLIGSGVVTVGASVGVTLGVGMDNKVGSFTGVIENGSGTMNVTKYGTGIQVLSGVNTYTGATVVSAGTLLINNPGSLAASAVTVANGATLGGSGTLNGTVTIASGSTMSPGDTNAVGTLTLANDTASALTLNGAILRFDLSNVSGVCDKVALSGTSSKLVLNGVNIIALSFPNGVAPQGTYTLMTCAGGITTNPGGSLVLQNAYPNATLAIGENDVVLTVGEGGTYGLTWKGNVSDVWDSGLNWTNGVAAVAFTNGDHVAFDDTAIGNFTVSSGSPVSPGSVLFNNSANAYTVTAAISGTGPLIKQGTGMVTLSGVSDYNPLLITVYPGASLALSGASTLNSGSYAGNINNFGTLTYSSSATQTVSGVVSGSGAMIVNSGALNLGSASSNTLGAVTVSGGAAGSALKIGGLTSLGANTLLVGNATGSRSTVMIEGDVTLGRIQAGTTDNANSAGAVYHNSGMVTASSVHLSLGEGTGDFGYYRLASGLVQATAVSDVNIATKGHGVLEMTGGVLNLSSAVFLGKGGVAGVAGTLNIFGGVLNGSTNNDNYITMGGTAGQSFGQLNVGGSGALNIAGGLNKTRGLALMYTDNNTNVVNLLPGGTLIANKVWAEKTTGRSIFNFNGGTLTTTNTSTVGAAFLQGLTAAYVYPGNAFIDTTSLSLTVAQPLLMTTGYGLSSITLGNNGSGYIGAPAVVLLGGSGTGATAIAQHDFNTTSPTYGQITNILVTCPGSGYQAGDTLTVSLRGGGFVTPASATCTLGANPVGGGLTKLGSGTLILSGTNTYAGATTISSGTLRLGIANALPTNSVVNVGSNVYDLNGFTVTNGAVTLASGGTIMNGKLESSSVTVDGGAVIKAGVASSADITKNGGGTLSINRYISGSTTGSLVVNGGTLKLVVSPLDAGLSYWLDAMDLSKLTLSGTNVTAWADSTTNGVNFTQGTAIQQPVYVDSVINGHPAVRFIGMTNRMVAAKTANAQTVFIVNSVRGYRGTDGIWGQSGQDTGIRLTNITTWNHPGNVNDFTTAGGSMYINGILTNIFSASTPHVLTAVSSSLRSGWTTAIGDYWAAAGQWRSYNGDIGEVLVYGSVLSAADRKSVEGYLMSKWFGTANTNLPAGGAVLLASGTLLDLGGESLSFADLSGSGTVSNGALTVTGSIMPGGTNAIGTLTAKVNTTLSGKLAVDVATDGTCDRLDVQGSLTLSSPTLEIVNLQGLSTLKVYTLVTCSGTLTGSLTLPENLSNTLWTLRKTTDNKIQLYYRGGTMIRIL